MLDFDDCTHTKILTVSGQFKMGKKEGNYILSVTVRKSSSSFGLNCFLGKLLFLPCQGVFKTKHFDLVIWPIELEDSIITEYTILL